MNDKLAGHFGTLLFCLIATFPNLVFAQAAELMSAREEFVLYDPSELNPDEPGYSWEGSTLLQDIRVVDGMGNRSSGLDPGENSILRGHCGRREVVGHRIPPHEPRRRIPGHRRY